MKVDVSFLNPVRNQDAMKDFGAAKSTSRAGWKVELVLDLNVIYRMEKCIFENATLEAAGLSSFVEHVRAGNLSLVPGFAIGEVKEEYSARLRAAFEAFVQRHLPVYVDTPNATITPEKDRTNSRLYGAATPGKQAALSQCYICMLLLFIIGRGSTLSSLEKFQLYVDRMTSCAGGVGAVEALLGQFVFYDRSQVPTGLWSDLCRSIRNNFLKSSGSVEKVLLNSYNQAHDIYLLRSATSTHGEPMEEYRGQYRADCWIATADQGLADLASCFYFQMGDDGRSTGGVCITDYVTAHSRNDQFWLASYGWWEHRSLLRSVGRGGGASKDMDCAQLQAQIDLLHAEAASLFDGAAATS